MLSAAFAGARGIIWLPQCQWDIYEAYKLNLPGGKHINIHDDAPLTIYGKSHVDDLRGDVTPIR